MIDVVGVGTSGYPGLPPELARLVDGAELVIAAPRLLDTLPAQRPARPAADQEHQEHQERRTWPSPLLPALPRLLADCEGRQVVVLASGDPLVSGVGSTLIRAAGTTRVRVHPAVSSVALARARMGWPAESHETISLVSAPVETVHRWLTPGARLILLSAGSQTPGQLAGLLCRGGWRGARLSVLSRLGDPEESRLDATAADLLANEPVLPPLNIVAVDLGQPDSPADAFGWGWSPGLPDEAFDHDGQLTKWELRVAALARLRPCPGHVLWDLGAGCGSISIEWARTHPTCRAVAVERNSGRAELIRRNATALGVPRAVDVRESLLSAAVFVDFPPPDAVFIGGGATAGVVDEAWRRLPAGGRLVAHAVTMETERVLLDAHARYGGHLRRLAVERVSSLGTMSSWTPARPVVQWAAVKREEMP